MNKGNKTQLALATLAVVALSACSLGPPPKLVLDPALADADVYEVDGLRNRYWGKPLTFGPFHTEKTRVGETWNWSVGLFGRGLGRRTDPYRFYFVDDAGDRRVRRGPRVLLGAGDRAGRQLGLPRLQRVHDAVPRQRGGAG